IVFLATPARICIVWVSSTNLRYGNVQGEKVLRAVVLSGACHDDLLCGWSTFHVRPPKASGPGLTVRCADNRTGARDEGIIETAFLKSSGIFGTACSPPAPTAGGPADQNTLGMVGKSPRE